MTRCRHCGSTRAYLVRNFDYPPEHRFGIECRDRRRCERRCIERAINDAGGLTVNGVEMLFRDEVLAAVRGTRTRKGTR